MVGHRVVYMNAEVEIGAEMVILSLFLSFPLNKSFACYKKKKVGIKKFMGETRKCKNDTGKSCSECFSFTQN